MFLSSGPPSTSPAHPQASAPPHPKRSRPPAATTSSCASPWRSQQGSSRRRSYDSSRRKRSCSASSSCRSWINEPPTTPPTPPGEPAGLRCGLRGRGREKGNIFYLKSLRALCRWLEIKKKIIPVVTPELSPICPPLPSPQPDLSREAIRFCGCPASDSQGGTRLSSVWCHVVLS